MRNRIFTVLVLLFLGTMSNAQRHVCGVTYEDQKGMLEFIDHFNKTGAQHERSVDPIYVPVKFHLVSKNDGSGRIKAASVLDQLTVMNEDYQEMGIYLYIDDKSFNYLNSTSIYENPSSFANLITSNKDPNAANIFICENADLGTGNGGTTLGYYSPSGDYIIVRLEDVRDASSTLTHELGHFFSLPHPFVGWEGIYAHFGWLTSGGGVLPWDVDQFNGMFTGTTVPGTNLAVEVVNGSNCSTAADKICDTPPDYNFGLGAGGCVWNNTLSDRNGDVIDPQENNIMSYFSCDDFDFTEGQTAVMFANYNSNQRSYLRKSYVPDTTLIVSNHDLLFPIGGEALEYYTNVRLDWMDADGASQYLVSINTGDGDFFELYTDESELLLEELEPNTFYFYEVRPFNDGNTRATSKNDFFVTGSEINTSVKESEIISNINIYPNPASSGQDINVALTMESSKSVSLSLIDLTGKLISRENRLLSQGNNVITMNAVAETGIYILKMDTEDGTIHKKVMIR